ncbi:hypothetical protein, partial [Streptomyces sp. NPDC051098]|uniref:hypothetical protein n=1 Tax=Streptomyces sp. NPDC051098 TaxID=3155411 RepID=UPI003427F755
FLRVAGRRPRMSARRGYSSVSPHAPTVSSSPMYALDDQLQGAAYLTPAVLARDERTRCTFGDLSDDAVPAVVLYPTD